MEQHGPKASDNLDGRVATDPQSTVCRYLGDERHVCASSFGAPLQPGQVCFAESRTQLTELIDRNVERWLAEQEPQPQDPEQLRRLADKDRWLAREADDSISLERRLRMFDLEEIASDAREAAWHEWTECRDDVA